MTERDEIGDEEAARLGCAGFALGVGCAPFVFFGVLVVVFAVAVALRGFVS